MDYDLIIRGGTVVDGSGAPRFRADVALKDRKIAAVIAPADTAAATAAREIDAIGMVVAPGFIDLHSHSDWVVPIPDHGEILKPFLMQGVTTFVGGNCGFSTAPVRRESQRMLDESGRLCAERKFDWEWDSVGGFAAALKRQGLALNVAHLAGHGSIRPAQHPCVARDGERRSRGQGAAPGVAPYFRGPAHVGHGRGHAGRSRSPSR